jgi:hypothetical protein
MMALSKSTEHLTKSANNPTLHVEPLTSQQIASPEVLVEDEQIGNL